MRGADRNEPVAFGKIRLFGAKAERLKAREVRQAAFSARLS
jgi:hypothetical protein